MGKSVDERIERSRFIAEEVHLARAVNELGAFKAFQAEGDICFIEIRRSRQQADVKYLPLHRRLEKQQLLGGAQLGDLKPKHMLQGGREVDIRIRQGNIVEALRGLRGEHCLTRRFSWQKLALILEIGQVVLDYQRTAPGELLHPLAEQRVQAGSVERGYRGFDIALRERSDDEPVEAGPQLNPRQQLRKRPLV